MEICFLCTGNASRSPMAEIIAINVLKQLGKDWVVCSRGTEAAEGEPVSRKAVFVCGEIGLDISGKKRKRLDNDVIQGNTIFIVMEPGHIIELKESFGVSGDRIYMLGNGIPDPRDCDIEVYRSCRDKLVVEIKKLVTVILNEQSDMKDPI